MYKLLLLVLPIYLMAWNFTTKDFNELSDKQLEVINTSYKIGNMKELGLSLAAISIVETRGGTYLGNTNNHICGSHQVDVKHVMASLNSNGDLVSLCKTIREHNILSSLVSLSILNYWKNNSSSYREMILSYNRGWKKHKHDKVYWSRFTKVLTILKQQGY